ncbi:MAG: Crp/Fnr family transcriptional regulator [bacterium]|nr:Crp/Fnr family transcriptional regulator [bacterium]
MKPDTTVELTSLFEYFKKFNPLSLEAEHAIASISKAIDVKKNTVLQPIGHTCKTIYFIKKGLARIYYFKDGVDITESFAFENNSVARVESLFTGVASKKAIQLIENSELVAINATQLFKLYDTYPQIERLFRLIVESAYVETIHRIESIQFHTAEERYKILIKEAPDVLKRVPLKYIASYLGITQVSLSRIRGLK